MSYNPQHIKCQIEEEGSQSFLPTLPPNASHFQKFRRNLRKLSLISEKNPRCGHFYRSTAEVISLRQEHARSKILVIHPFSVFRLYFEFYMGFVFLICLLYMPFDAAFDCHEQDDLDLSFRIASCIVSVLCYIDIFLRFNTGIANEREKTVIMDRKQIIKGYLLSIHFYADVLSSLPDSSILIKQPVAERVFDIFSMLKILRIKTMFDYLSRMAEYFNVKNTYFDVIRILMLIYLTVHWVGCICFLVPQTRRSITGKFHRYSWVVYSKIYRPSSGHTARYVRSIYRAGGYILGIRFDSRDVKVMEEAVLTCVMYAFGKVFTIALVVILLNRLLMLRSFETKYQEIIEQVEGFVIRQKFPPQLMEKLFIFYDYKYYKTYFNEGKITALFSESIKKEINAQALSGLTETVTIFADLPEPVLINILSHLHAEIYLPHDVIIKAGDPGDCLYFIASGTVAVLTPSGKEVCHLYDGAYFGEICLLLKEETKRTANVIALEICEVYKMNKRSFFMCFKDLKDLRRKMEVEAIERREKTQAFEDLFMGAYRAYTA